MVWSSAYLVMLCPFEFLHVDKSEKFTRKQFCSQTAF